MSSSWARHVSSRRDPHAFEDKWEWSLFRIGVSLLPGIMELPRTATIAPTSAVIYLPGRMLVASELSMLKLTLSLGPLVMELSLGVRGFTALILRAYGVLNFLSPRASRGSRTSTPTEPNDSTSWLKVE